VSTTPVQLRLEGDVIAILDRLAAEACARTPGASATRASVGAALLSRAAVEADKPDPFAAMCAAVGTKAPPTEVTDKERLRVALGEESQRAAERRIGVPKGTMHSVLHRGAPLATAGGGKLLAWVESCERVLSAPRKGG
jgi:hypothetical protein